MATPNRECRPKTTTSGGNTIINCQCEAITVSIGDPHIRAWDGAVFDFQGAGEYIYAERAGVSIQVRQERAGDRVSFTTAVAVGFGLDRVGFYLRPAPAVHINGETINLVCRQNSLQALATSGAAPAPCELRFDLPSGTHFERSGNDYRLSSTSEDVTLSVSFGTSSLTLQVSQTGTQEAESVPLIGLAGAANASLTEGLRTRGGAVLSYPPTFEDLYHRFGESWRVGQAESLFDYGPSETTASFSDPAFPSSQPSTEQLEPSVRATSEAICRDQGLSDPTWLEACTLDVALSGNAELAGAFANVEPAARSMKVLAPLNDAQRKDDWAGGSSGCSLVLAPNSNSLSGLCCWLGLLLARALRGPRRIQSGAPH